MNLYLQIDDVDTEMENILKNNDIVGNNRAYPVNKSDMVYPDDKAYVFVKNELKRKGVSLEEIAKEAYIQQSKFDDSLSEDDFVKAIKEILHKREVLNGCMVGLSLDKLATEKQLDEPLQTIIYEDQPAFGVDETLALNICQLYGSVAATQFGHLDVSKSGIAKKLDSNSNGEVNTFIDDLVSALISCTEAKVMHQNAGN